MLIFDYILSRAGGPHGEKQISPTRPTPDRTGEPEKHTRPLSEYGLADFYAGSGEGRDPLERTEPYGEWWLDALDRGYYLYGMPLVSAPAARVAVKNPRKTHSTHNLINFASYNYLGLSYREEVINAAVDAVKRYGQGSAGSALLSGTTDLYDQLRDELASFMARPAVLLFPTGYGANLGIIAGLMRPGDTILADQLAHASIVDGMGKGLCEQSRPLQGHTHARL